MGVKFSMPREQTRDETKSQEASNPSEEEEKPVEKSPKFLLISNGSVSSTRIFIKGVELEFTDFELNFDKQEDKITINYAVENEIDLKEE